MVTRSMQFSANLSRTAPDWTWKRYRPSLTLNLPVEEVVDIWVRNSELVGGWSSVQGNKKVTFIHEMVNFRGFESRDTSGYSNILVYRLVYEKRISTGRRLNLSEKNTYRNQRYLQRAVDGLKTSQFLDQLYVIYII
jgi:hypothetical protein